MNAQVQCTFDVSCNVCQAGEVCGFTDEPCITKTDNFHLPKTYAAFGDSYSAGIGAGLFVSGSGDGRDNACARMSDSYPYQLKKAYPSPFESPIDPWREFYSCSGAVLDNIDGQLAQVSGRQFDVIVLSIGGNDFLFSKVVVCFPDVRYYLSRAHY